MLPAHHGQHRPGHRHRAEQVGLDLRAHLLGRELLEEAGQEAAGVVEQHVDTAEAVDGSGHGVLGAVGVGHVEGGDEQVLVRADGRAHGVGVAAGGHDVVTGGQGRAGELDAHAATGAGDKPSLRHGLDGRSALGPEGGAVSPPHERPRARLGPWIAGARSVSS